MKIYNITMDMKLILPESADPEKFLQEELAGGLPRVLDDFSSNMIYRLSQVDGSMLGMFEIRRVQPNEKEPRVVARKHFAWKSIEDHIENSLIGLDHFFPVGFETFYKKPKEDGGG